MPTFRRKKMCSECPFRANALRGWLGPMKVSDLMQAVHGVEVAPSCYVGDLGSMICHLSAGKLLDKGMIDQEVAENGQMCVGFIRYANSVLKISKIPEVRRFQEDVKATSDIPTIPPFKLLEHHSVEI